MKRSTDTRTDQPGRHLHAVEEPPTGVATGPGGRWNKTNRMHLLELARNPKNPHWLRIAMYAQAKMHTDGHYNISADEISQLLGRDMSKHLAAVVKESVTHGFLHWSSNARCLVVPGGVSTLYANATPCKVKHKMMP